MLKFKNSNVFEVFKNNQQIFFLFIFMHPIIYTLTLNCNDIFERDTEKKKQLSNYHEDIPK